jgi:hypothetical protein
VRALEKDCGCSVLSQSGAETELLCPRSRLSEVIAVLRGKGFKPPVAAERTDYVFAEVNRLTDRLKHALKRSPG